MPTEAWNHLCGTIWDVGQEADCWPIVDWICVALMKKVGDEKLPLDLPRPTTLLTVRDLLLHRHHMLTLNLPRIEPAFQRVQGLLIGTHTREVSVEMQRERETNTHARKADEENRVPDLLITNLIYLLCLGQVSEHERKA